MAMGLVHGNLLVEAGGLAYIGFGMPLGCTLHFG